MGNVFVSIYRGKAYLTPYAVAVIPKERGKGLKPNPMERQGSGHRGDSGVPNGWRIRNVYRKFAMLLSVTAI